MGDTTIDAREGGMMDMIPAAPPIPADQKRMAGRVLVWDPPHVFEHEWNQRIVEPGVVRYELVADGGRDPAEIQSPRARGYATPTVSGPGRTPTWIASRPTWLAPSYPTGSIATARWPRTRTEDKHGDTARGGGLSLRLRAHRNFGAGSGRWSGSRFGTRPADRGRYRRRR